MRDDSEHSKNTKKEVTMKREMSESPFKITSKHVQNCRKPTVSDFTSVIMLSLFTNEELASSSPTGRVYNASKSENSVPAKALDQAQYKAALRT